tara:strand:- start:289 stop:540 length:252 start_codon:yes stop_codon:yes gene_type:complete
MTVNEGREQCRPEEVRILFIAEAPPCAADRFFYFTEVNKGDSLFLYVIRAFSYKFVGYSNQRVQRNERGVALQISGRRPLFRR